MIPLIDLKRQYLSIKDEIDQAVQTVINNSSFISGEPIKKFEEAFARLCEVNFAVATSSGTSALYLALIALGIGPGDEVITAPNTLIATTEAISHSGAQVVFVDVNEQTYNIDVEKIESVITKRTKVIIPVHLYGQAADMDAIRQIARKHQLKIVEDASQAHLGEFQHKRVGSFGDLACFSFYPAKNLGAYGDAGTVVTNDKKLAESIKMIADHGRISKYEHQTEGFNFRMDTLQAAILNVKLKHLFDWTQKRRQIADIYNHELHKWAITPFVDERVQHVYHQYVLRVPKRDEVRTALANKGIVTAIHYPIPLHLQNAYQYLNYKKGDFPVTEKVSQEILSIPIFPELTPEEIETIIKNIKNVCRKFSQEKVILNV